MTSLERRVRTGYGMPLEQVLFFYAARTFSTLHLAPHGPKRHLSQVRPARFCFGIPRHVGSLEQVLQELRGHWTLSVRFTKDCAPSLKVVAPRHVLVDTAVRWLPAPCLMTYELYLQAKRVDRCLTVTAHTPTELDPVLSEYLVRSFDRDGSDPVEVVDQTA